VLVKEVKWLYILFELASKSGKSSALPVSSRSRWLNLEQYCTVGQLAKTKSMCLHCVHVCVLNICWGGVKNVCWVCAENVLAVVNILQGIQELMKDFAAHKTWLVFINVDVSCCYRVS